MGLLGGSTGAVGAGLSWFATAGAVAAAGAGGWPLAAAARCIDNTPLMLNPAARGAGFTSGAGGPTTDSVATASGATADEM